MTTFDVKISELMQEYNIPGLSMAIIRDSQISYVNSKGTKNWETQEPVDHNTLFGIGSVSKSFTALAILQLYERGELDINDPINKYLPIRQDKKEEPITIKHLLTMSSGIPDLGVLSLQLDIICNRNDDVPIIPLASEEDLMQHINQGLSEGTLPGDRFFYFNSGYTMLGYIVEKITGLSFSEYIDKNIFQPLNMARTTFSKDTFYSDSNHSKGYIIDHYEGMAIPREEKPVFHKFFEAPGGIMSNITDLANYLIMHMRGGKYESTRIIETETLDLAHRIQYEGESVGDLSKDHGKNGYGFGLAIFPNFLGHKFITHSGSVGVYSAFMGFFPEIDVGIVMLANVDLIPLEIKMRLAAYATGKPVNSLNGLSYHYYMKALCGKYKTFKNANTATVTMKGGVLRLEIPRWKVDVVLIPMNRSDVYPEKFIVINPFGGEDRVKFTTKNELGERDISFLYQRSHFHLV